MMLDHAYPNLVKAEENDLMVLHHMDNETLIRLSKYTTNWPEPKTKTEFFGFIKDEKYEDPDPVNHLKWKNDAEMKEKSAADELTKLEDFSGTRNERFTKVEKEKKRGGKRTPKVQTEEGSSSQSQKKRKKKAVETMLVDEPEEDETEANVEIDHDQLSPETGRLMRDIDDTLEAKKTASEKVVGDEEKSLSGSEHEVDAKVDKWIKENYDPRDRETQKKRKRRSGDDDDETYVPPEDVQVVAPPSSGESKVLEKLDDFSFVNDDLVKELQKKVDEIDADQADIDILKVRIAELEEEKARRDEQNEYFKLKNKELEANNAMKEHEAYMMKKVLENLIGKAIEQRFEEIELEEVRARRKAEIEAEMKDKGKSVPVEGVAQVTERAIIVSEPTKDPETSILDPCPICSVSDDVYSVHSDDDDDGNDDDDQGASGIKVTEASNEEKIDEYLHDDANEEPENASGKGEHDDAENVDQSTRLILRLEHDVEEGEILHTYIRAEIIKMTHIEDNEFNFDFEEELNKFDINQQPEYQYKYVEDVDNYDKVEVEDWSDEDQSENINVDTSSFPTLAEFFSQANEDELRRKVVESVKNKSFQEMSKEEQHEERKKWFRIDTERKFKRPLKYYKTDREVSLGDIISWGYLPQVNAYAIRREFGVQYFQYIQDIMSLPWWDVEELPKVRTLSYPVRVHDMPTWGLMKFEAFKEFKHWKPHLPKKVKRIDPVTGIEETILQIKKPRVLKNIPLPKMEQNFHEGFVCWVYSCMTTEAVIVYKVGNDSRYIHLYDPMWIVNFSTKDIECLFVNKIGYKAEDKDQALQFQKVVTICFQKGIKSENMWLSKWRKIDKEEFLKAKKERKEHEEKDRTASFTVVQRLAEEEKKVAKEKEKLKKVLWKKPKRHEEKFKSL
ncbi:uncharacterized protein LOC110914321 [Helianthus annuus]|uniref:uncharacterized protein LOC110914321 n=1 Tax=Helianthus annuus TaxID=4232 RepID=UPI000B8F55B9|nr:uncharacterized protein LOC110914321 [Helianthus annuus]